MRLTQHAHLRMTQRGITRSMIDLVLEYGQLEQDKAVLNRKRAQELIRELEEKLRTAKKILDKGDCVVIEADNAILTTYNYPSKH